ncbi:probable G-protein coupled receptor CG31760 isoform X2 [Gigantopelta aegis]|uniref:probable G-protein coupled receptor CG31760 isoform X2 n=1 Tax=Gigantopelta aegis TaxID=1735272 RepID=UPI001B88891E|nr:probable G-protein coupled receptor CG31760 isoform X2 [Gigantopelta aegis]
MRNAIQQVRTIEKMRMTPKEALYVVYAVEAGSCVSGTDNFLDVVFNYSSWRHVTKPGIHTSNYLSMIISMDHNFNRLDDKMFYSLARGNIYGEKHIYGSGIGIQPGVYDNHHSPRFCPYACKKNKTVVVFDIADNYDYLSPTNKWYQNIKVKDFSKVPIIEDIITFNPADPSQANISFRQPIVSYEDGQWTLPYFNCGGGDIWIVSYTLPILAISPSGLPVCQGVLTMDIELTDVDINQCDIEGNEILHEFGSTHNCQPTTKCVPVKGQGFKRGTYLCVCEDGYYFPDPTAKVKAYNGTVVEEYSDLKNASDMASRFRCLPCSRGCHTCVDPSPCIFQNNYIIRNVIACMIVLMIIACCCISLVVLIYKNVLIIKTASPVFLHLMCLGAIIMCCHMLVLYPEATDNLCIAEMWLFHTGFAIMYGALIIKTWRISVLFTVGMTKKINLQDSTLLTGMLRTVLCMIVYMACWTVIDPPLTTPRTANNNLKFFECVDSAWTYVINGIEATLLLYGIYLCYVVRKAPVYFNESKYITWSIYNAIVIGNFIFISTKVLAATTGPDTLYVLNLVLLQAYVTVTIALIFVPKLWALKYPGHTSTSSITNWKSYEVSISHVTIPQGDKTTQTDDGELLPN